MNLTFANPALLFGTLLFAVPLVIHLLNRRRFTPIRWAAQEFLLEAYHKTRRRLTLESLLLLLVRCVLVIFLALALARPFAPSSNPISMFTPSERNVVLAVDTSYSMTRVSGGETALDRAKEQARLLLDQLSAERGDRVTLVTLASKPQVLLQSSNRIELAQDAVARLKPEWRRADLVRTIETIDELVLAPATAHHEVFFFTDLQKATFDPDRDTAATAGADGPAEASPAAAMRRAATRDVRFSIVDVGAGEVDRNLSVEDLVSSPQNIVKDNVVSFTATVRNHGAQAAQGVRGAFILNGRREQARTQTFDVPARGVASVEFAASIKEVGYGSVEFELDEDELPGDDRRFLAFPVRESVQVLLVDGQYDKGEELRATAMLAALLNPAADDEIALSPYRTKTIDDRRFNLGSETLSDFDLIVLADVPRVDEKVASELADAVRAGAGVWIFAGDNLDIRAWNERFYRADGTGLLPARILDAKGDAAGDPSQAIAPRIDDLSHPVLELFRDPRLTPELKAARALRYLRTAIGPQDAATATILALDDEPTAPSALLLEKPMGHGRVVFSTTSADATWSTFGIGEAALMVYLPLVQEIAAFVTLPDLSETNLGIGDRIRRTERAIPSSIAVVLPNADRMPLEASFEERENGRYVMPTFDRTFEPGIYTLELEFPLGSASSSGERKVTRYAVNLDARESDGERLDARALAIAYPNVALSIVDRIEVGAKDVAATHAGELWRAALYLVLALLVAELLLSSWFDRRTLGGAPAGGRR